MIVHLECTHPSEKRDVELALDRPMTSTRRAAHVDLPFAGGGEFARAP